MRKLFIISLLFFSYFAHSQNNIYRSGGISQTIGPPTYTPGTGGNVVAIDTLTGFWYVNPNRLSSSTWINNGTTLTNISGSVKPAYTPTKFQSRLVINAVDSMYYYDGVIWNHVNPSRPFQTVDTFDLTGQTLRLSLSNDGQAAKTVTLPQSITSLNSLTATSQAFAIGTSGTDFNISSATNTHTFNLPTASATNRGLLNSSDWSTFNGKIGGTGTAGRVAFWRSTSAISSDANMTWDSSNVRLNIGNPSSPTARFNVKGGGSTSSTVNLRLTNSGNTEILKVTDDGELTVFKPLTASGRLATFYGYQAPYQLEASIEVGMRNPDDGIALLGGSNIAASRGGFIQTKNATTRSISFNSIGAVKVCGPQILTTDYTGLSVGASQDIGTNIPTIEGVVFRTISATMTSTGGNSNNFNQSTFGQITVNRKVIPTTYTDAANVYIVGPPIQGTATLTNRFSLFVASGNSYFAENIGIGQKIASARLHVVGSNNSSGTNAFLVQNSTPSDLYKIENNGKISYLATNTTAGTQGNQTINAPSGTVNFAPGATSLVVTNSLCTTNSIVFPVIRTDDATATIKNVVPSAGFFTINLNAAATSETSVGFFIIN